MPPHRRQEPELTGELTAAELAAALGGSPDVVQRRLRLAGGQCMSLFFVDGLISSAQLSETAVRPLQRCTDEGLRGEALIARLELDVLDNLETRTVDTLDKAAEALLNGSGVLVFDEIHRALTFQARGGETRAVSEPSIENVLKGGRDAFVETLRVNTALVRRKIRSPRLRIRETLVGRQTRTRVAVLWMDRLTRPETVRLVRERVERLDVDSLLSVDVLEESLAEGTRSAFPLLMYTDLTDRFCKNIVEGRVGLLVDGLPVGYAMPATLPQLMRAPEDDGSNYIIASLIRLLRYGGLMLTLLLPAFYVAIAAFHQEMIPFELARAIVASKQDVPFTTTVEVVGMLVAFEVLQEAGLRLPRTIGQSVSIIGALVVGQSAVEAKIFSPVVVIVVATAGVAGYVIPNQDMAAALRIWRLLCVVAAALLGLYGLTLAFLVLVFHLATLETFGVPYLAPLAGRGASDVLKRTLLRAPVEDVPYREETLEPVNRRSRSQ